jgi:hypothetical protein
MESFSSLIDCLGGAAVVAKFAGGKPGTFQQMKARNSVPTEYWPALIALAQERGVAGITHEYLTELSIRAKQARRRAA